MTPLLWEATQNARVRFTDGEGLSLHDILNGHKHADLHSFECSGILTFIESIGEEQAQACRLEYPEYHLMFLPSESTWIELHDARSDESIVFLLSDERDGSLRAEVLSRRPTEAGVHDWFTLPSLRLGLTADADTDWTSTLMTHRHRRGERGGVLRQSVGLKAMALRVVVLPGLKGALPGGGGGYAELHESRPGRTY